MHAKYEESAYLAFKDIRVNHLRIHNECEGGIGKSVPRIIVWGHEVCIVMTNSDHKGQIFQSHPHTNNGFVVLLTIKYKYSIF